MHPRSFLFFAACSLALTSSRAAAQCTTLVSVNSQGEPANHESRHSMISADGRFVVFESLASNLAANDYGGDDVFLHDRADGTTMCVTLDVNGAASNGASILPSISADARFVAYASWASDLVTLDTNNQGDIFLYDRVAGTTIIASRGSGTGAPQANGASSYPVLAANGTALAFSSGASNLVPSDTNLVSDVFVRDLATGALTMASVSSSGAQANGYNLKPVLSDSGRIVAFESHATNMVPGDTNGQTDIFVRDLDTNTTVRASVSSAGIGANDLSWAPSLSPDGTKVAFGSAASNLIAGDSNGMMDVFVHDLVLGRTTLISENAGAVPGDGTSYQPRFSADGRFIVFTSVAKNLAPDSNPQYDVFVHDLLFDTTELVSLDTLGAQADKASYDPSLSAFGRAISFSSSAPLTPGPSDMWSDIFVREGSCHITTYCTAKMNSQLCIPAITTLGAPNSGGFDNFHVGASSVIPKAPGILIWSNAASATSFGGGTLCIATPLVRTSAQLAGGDAAVTCSGTYDFLFGQSYMASHGLAPGVAVYAQIWSRDNGFSAPNNVGLTDAVRFVIGL
ncbi:MAG: calcium-binding protein [Planctomycetes bacterium]|nr:calcium-binding protein [Planctomycetota bacterium]